MTDATHFLVTASGGYTDHPEESWQVGIRYSFDTGAGPVADNGPLTSFGVTPDATVTSHADWITTNQFLAVNGLFTVHPDDWLNDQLAPAWTTFMTDAHINHFCRLDTLKVSPITATGHVADLRTSRLDWTASNPLGGSSGNLVPPEVSIACSWSTPVIGKKGRGRIFLPPTIVGSIDTDGMILDSVCQAVRDAAVAMLEASVITSGILASTWVLPIVTGSPWTNYGRITGVRVGHVFDSQRRRRRSLVEAYDSAPVSY